MALWEISDQESSSDHIIIKYVMGQPHSNPEHVDFQEVRYLVNKENNEKFTENLTNLAITKLCGIYNAITTDDLDRMLCARISQEADIEKSIEEFHVILKTTCNKT